MPHFPLIDRLRRHETDPPVLDRARAEAALARHFRGSGLEGLPVRWARDGVDGFRESARADGESAWHFECGAARRAPYWTATDSALIPDDRSPIPRAARRAAWTRPEIRALQLAQREACRDPVFTDIFFPSSPRSAGLGAAMLAVPGAPAEVWAPLLDAIDAGLWIYWVLDDEILAVPRPELRTAAGRLHAADGPAVSWPGGGRWWCWRGVEVPRFVVERPDLLTPRRILDEPDAEVRREMLDRFGAARFLEASGVRAAQADDFGTLYFFEFGDGEPLVMVKVVNATPEPDGSRKDYLLRVPPGTATAREAVAWTFGLGVREYAPSIES